jgi:hypothetical protein
MGPVVIRREPRPPFVILSAAKDRSLGLSS